MPGITKEEFSKIYQEQFVPILRPLDSERSAAVRKSILVGFVGFGCFICCIIGSIIEKWPIAILAIAGFIASIFLMNRSTDEFRKKLKKSVITKILALCGQLYMSDNKNVVTKDEIKQMGLFPRFSTKRDDDVIIGLHKGCNFAILETTLCHMESRGKHSEEVEDFNGLIVKVTMNKPFTSKTIVGIDGYINRKNGFEEVLLEDVEFSKHLKVYSTDQIEARYILTTAFMERLRSLGESFTKNRYSETSKFSKADIDAVNNVMDFMSKIPGVSNTITRAMLVSAAFIDGYAYLFIPKYEDFFEIDVMSSLLDETQYYDVYCQLQLILSVIEYLKLDMKLGM